MQCSFVVSMACRGGSKVLLCLGLLLVANCHCARVPKLKVLDNLRKNTMLHHGQSDIGQLWHGKLIIAQNSLQRSPAPESLLDSDAGYQADMGWGYPRYSQEGYGSAKASDETVERILKMEPKVECTGESMKLNVQDSTQGTLLFVDRGSRQSPLPLSKLPSSCGYTMKSTQKDLVLAAPYDGCFVAVEEDSYVLPLRWLGLPVKMSCPLMGQPSPNPPMVTCRSEDMVVKTYWTLPLDQIKVKVFGSWQPLMKTSQQCGFGVVKHPEGVVISAPYTSCLEKKNGMYTMELEGGRETKISCPVLSFVEPKPTKCQANEPCKPPEIKPRDPQPPASKAPQIDPSPPHSEKRVPQTPVQHAYQTIKPYIPYNLLPPGFYRMPIPPTQASTPVSMVTKPVVPNVSPRKPSPENRDPGQPVPSWGQVYQPYYCPYSYINRNNEPAENPTEAPKPPQTDAPQHPSYMYLKPEMEPVVKPTDALKPAQPDVQVYQPFNFNPHPRLEIPTKAPKPAQPEARVPLTLNPFYYSQPPLNLQHPQKVDNPVDQPPLKTDNPSFHCSQFCPSGFGNCCLKVAFHQHHHHTVPAGPGKDTPSVYTGLPFLPLAAYPPSTRSPYLEYEEQTASLPPLVLLQPPEGNLATQTGGNPIKVSNPEQMFPDSGIPYPYWTFASQWQPPNHNVPSENQASLHEPVKPVVPDAIHSSMQSPGDHSYNSAPVFGQDLPKQTNDFVNEQLQPPGLYVQDPQNGRRFPYFVVQDAQTLSRKSPVPMNSAQSLGSKNRADQSADASNSYILLPHGPPIWTPDDFTEAPPPFRHLNHDVNFAAQSPLKNLGQPQENPKHPTWPKGLLDPLPELQRPTTSRAQPKGLTSGS